MNRYWSSLTKSLQPYIPGEQTKGQSFIKLNTNENPFSPPRAVIDAINKASCDLRLYPPPEADFLRESIATNFSLTKDEVFVGNGSDEILGFCFPAFFENDKPILFPDITYSFYKVYATLFKVNYKLVPLDDEYRIVPETFTQKNGGIIIANPNAPTGICLSIAEIEIILKNNPNSVVMIDEAYIDFGGTTAVRLIPKYDNLLVIQTLSKSRSLAGLRVGFALGNASLIEALTRIKNSFNSYTLDRLAIAGAIASFNENDYFEKTRKEIMAVRDETANALQKLGFRVLPSKANFLFVSHERIAAKVLFAKLQAAGILVRYFDAPRIDNFLRITIGTAQDMRDLIVNLRMIIGRV